MKAYASLGLPLFIFWCFLSQKHGHLDLPAFNSVVNKQAQTEPSSIRKVVPLMQIHSFTQLLENMHHIEVNFLQDKSLELCICGVLTQGLPLPLYCVSKSSTLSVPISFYSSAVSPIAPICLDWEQMEYNLSIKHEDH